MWIVFDHSFMVSLYHDDVIRSQSLRISNRVTEIGFLHIRPHDQLQAGLSFLIVTFHALYIASNNEAGGYSFDPKTR